MLSHEIINAQEEERRSVSRELHDEAGQLFITLKHNLGIILEELPIERDQVLRTKLESAIGLVDRSMDMMRSLSHRLRPPALEVGGINISLEDLCQDIAEQTNLKVTYFGEDIPGLPNDIAISLYRVVQEALTNVLKHAHARKVQVHLKRKKEIIEVRIEDDGIGYQASSREGTGLLGLKERLNLLGGEIQVDYRSGKGFHLVATVPWTG